MGHQVSLCCDKRDRLAALRAAEAARRNNRLYMQMLEQHDRDLVRSPQFNDLLQTEPLADDMISDSELSNASPGKDEELTTGNSYLPDTLKYSQKPVRSGFTATNALTKTVSISLIPTQTESGILKRKSSQQSEPPTHLENKIRSSISKIRKTVSFIDEQVHQHIEDNELTLKEVSRISKMATPGGEDDEALPYDEENMVMFHHKPKLQQFFQEYCGMENNLFFTSARKYYVPSIICNSPRDLTNEAMIILRNNEELQNYKIHHVKHSRLCENFKVYDFTFHGEDPVTWKDQLLNDLKNFYSSEKLELIGAVNTFEKHSPQGLSRGKNFQLVFYRQPQFRMALDKLNFPFFVEIIYEELSQKALQSLLNQKIIDDNATLRTSLTVYKYDNSVLCHILLFERKGSLEENNGVYMVVEGTGRQGLKEDEMHHQISEWLYQEELCQHFKITGVLSKSTLDKSLFIFSAE